MDKTWVNLIRTTEEYKEGAKKFIKYVASKQTSELIRCPCINCQNLQRCNSSVVYEHLVIYGMDKSYKTWVWHGEELNSTKSEKEPTETYKLCRALYAHDDCDLEPTQDESESEFTELLEDAERPLFPGCTKYTKLSATVVLYKHKVLYGLSDKAFSALLVILHDMFPAENTIPDSKSSAEKILKDFQLEDKQIHACVNDCCLFRKDLEKSDTCPKCHSSRWKVDEQTKEIRGVPAKVLRYFPIIPRFKRMFASLKFAEQLTWHHHNKSIDGNMRHPVDSDAWNHIDSTWPSFALEPRNLRLGLAADGINPFRDLSARYSCWPVIVIIYNLPPWLSMKDNHLMLSLLIPGPKQPGDDINVYLQPLIDDLLKLWDVGVEVYDAFTKTHFNLKAILMWIVNDFPAYGNLAGCTTKGKVACPKCGKETCSHWLPFSRKTVYLGNRRFLEHDDPYRFKGCWFDGKNEYREKPKVLTGSEILSEVNDIDSDWGKGDKNTKKRKRQQNQMWKKKSIFFELLYWEHLLIRHNLDVMHIEKNVCESIIGTLLDMKGKSKDGLNSRMDLQDMGIRRDLHPDTQEDGTFLPPAPHTLSKREKEIFCKRLLDLKLPDSYNSNISRHVVMEERKILGLKSHDCHVLMQQLMPVALKGLLPKGPRNAILRLCAFFNELCQKVISKERMQALEKEIVETLCMLERFFPPSFFDIMIHLTIHLPEEARLGGPVPGRWMYGVERYMKILKGFVRNRARPEGCIVKCYIADETLKFCSEYVKQAAELGEQPKRNDDFENDYILEGRPISKGSSMTLSDDKLRSAHRCILFNIKEVEPYLEEHLNELKRLDKSLSRNESLLWQRHNEKFASWLKNKIEGQMGNVSKLLRGLAFGPRHHALSYTGYVINGQRYRVKADPKSTQDYGVSIEATTMCRSSSKDTNQVLDKVSYYGVIKNIVLLDYRTFAIPLFDCDWANIRNGVKVDEGFTLVNLFHGQNRFERDSFILASQAEKVFYSRENESSNWYVVLKAPPRGFHELEVYEEHVEVSSRPLDVLGLDNSMDEDGTYVRSDCEGMLV